MMNDDQTATADSAASAAEHRIRWSALAPYAPLASAFDEDGALGVEATDYFQVTLAGHEWVSDRYMLIRAELLSGQPMSSQYLSTAPTDTGLTAALQKVLDRAHATDANANLLNPFYVALAEAHGWTLEPADRVWRIVLDDTVVGAVVGLREPVLGGRRPGDDLSRVQVALPFIGRNNPEAYALAARLVDALDAHDRASQSEPPGPVTGPPVHSHGPEEGAGLSCLERRLEDGSLRGACIPTDIPTRTWTPDRRNADGSTTLKVKRCCSGCGQQIGDPTQEELDALVSGAPLPSTTEEHGCQR